MEIINNSETIAKENSLKTSNGISRAAAEGFETTTTNVDSFGKKIRPKRTDQDPRPLYMPKQNGFLSTPGTDDENELEEKKSDDEDEEENSLRGRLFLAVRMNDVKQFMSIWQEAAEIFDPNDLNPKITEPGSLLHAACFHGALDVVKYLVENTKVNVDLPSGIQKQTPLHWAACGGHLAIVHYLLENPIQKANPAATDAKGYGVIHHATQNNHAVVIHLLLTMTAVSPDSKDAKGHSPLIWAVYKNHFDIVRYLVQQNADLDLQDLEGRTALHWACHKGLVRVTEYLIESGAGLSVKDNHGRTPLDLAEADKGNSVCAKRVKSIQAESQSNFPIVKDFLFQTVDFLS